MLQAYMLSPPGVMPRCRIATTNDWSDAFVGSDELCL